MVLFHLSRGENNPQLSGRSVVAAASNCSGQIVSQLFLDVDLHSLLTDGEDFTILFSFELLIFVNNTHSDSD